MVIFLTSGREEERGYSVSRLQNQFQFRKNALQSCSGVSSQVIVKDTECQLYSFRERVGVCSDGATDRKQFVFYLLDGGTVFHTSWLPGSVEIESREIFKGRPALFFHKEKCGRRGDTSRNCWSRTSHSPQGQGSSARPTAQCQSCGELFFILSGTLMLSLIFSEEVFNM